MQNRTITIDIGINGAFLTRRWEEPENFMRLTRELGYPYHEFCSDILDPFFSGDKEYRFRTARQIKAAAEKYKVKITDIYTGVATHRFHGLSHSVPAVRERMKEWISQTMDIALQMGVDRIGGHWDAISVEVLQNPETRKQAIENVYEQFREIASIAKDKGIKGIYNEQMYTPSEIPWTLKGAEEFLIEVNKNSTGVPVYLTVDTGHQAGGAYGLEGEDRDYRQWLKRFACACEIIHIQQTTPGASHHWPFTAEYNEKGCVRMDDVIEAITYSHRHFEQQPFSEYIQPAKKTILIAEIIPSSTKNEETVLEELKQTQSYLRKYIPEGGLEI